ncbi:MAG: helix-turn-helix domain-containing protein [Magnetococcales bacterium]|nr:helix-turn-helix domain-containing protein [Magnetococcales bacterium]
MTFFSGNLDSSKIWTRVSERLRERQINQKQLAALSGMNATSISNLKSGKSKRIMFQNIVALARALAVSPQWLAYGIGDMIEKTDKYLKIDWINATPETPPVAFTEEFLKDCGMGRVASLRLIRHTGSHLDAWISDGELAIIDCEKKNIESEGLFAIELSGNPGHFQLRYLRRKIHNDLIDLIASPTGPVIDTVAMDSIQIAGFVVARIRF